MKAKLMIVSAVVVVLLSLVACSSQDSRTVRREVNCDSFVKDKHISEEAEVSVDNALTVVLCSNPSTGFQWSEQAHISDQSVLQQTSHMYISPTGENGEPPAPGTPGKDVWTFGALKTGTAEVSMEYSQLWEGSEKEEWTFDITVVIR